MTAGDVRTALAAAAATLLGALALSPVLSSGTWVRPVVDVVLVVLLTGLALRFAGAAIAARVFPGRPVPGAVAALGTALVPLGQLAAVTGYLARRFTEAGGLLPTPAGVRELVAVLGDGTEEIAEQVAPALPVASLTALIAVFVGLVAVLVDLLAVAARQGALAGLALLALVGVPVFTLGGDIGLVPVVAPAAGFALLLWADQAGRLEAAGRVSGPRSVGGSTALRIGGVAVLVGVLGGGVLPTLAEGTVSGGEGPGSTGTRLDPVAAMYGQLTRNEPVDLLRMDASIPDPGYLRAVTVDRYDVDDGWTLGGFGPRLPLDPPLPAQREEFGRGVTATIAALGHDDRFLPVPASPVSVLIEGRDDDWLFDPVTGTVVGQDTTSEGLRYEVTANEVRPDADQLRTVPPLGPNSAIQQRFTELPPLDPRVTDLVDRLVADAGDGYSRVRAILDFLTDSRNGFSYALSTAPGTSDDDLVDFLDERRGYCEQYAGAMAVMVRHAGMPARVALGYTPGTLQDDGSRLITSDDAHAWVEVYFNGRGWVPFDPTPIDITRRAELPWAPRVAVEELPEQNPELSPEIPPELYLLGDPLNPLVPGGEATDGAVPEAAPEAEESWAAPVGLTLLLVGAGAGVPAGVRLLQRRRRVSLGTAAALWDEVTATADDLGVTRDPAWTPREAGRALAERTGPEGAAAIARLARAEELAGYGPATSVQEDGLDAALRTARRELRGSVDRSARLRAAFWPASLPAAVHAGLPAWVRGRAGMRRSRRPGGRRLRAEDAGS